MEYGLKDSACVELNLQGFSNSKWAKNVPNRKSTLGCCFSPGSATISWCSKKQSCVGHSTAKAKHIASCVAENEDMWLRKLLAGLIGQPLDHTMIMCDNQSCVKLLVNQVFHDRTKHVEIKYHCLRDMVQQKVVAQLHFYRGADYRHSHQDTSKNEFCYFREKLGIVENDALVEKESKLQ